MNNINTNALADFVAEVEDDPAAARKHKQVTGTWHFQDKTPQFHADLAVASGDVAVKAELSQSVGGWDTSPDPVQYCLYGMAACYAGVFAATASAANVTLTKLEVTAENWMDLRKQVGLSSDDIIEKVRFTVRAEGSPEDALAEVAELTRQRCPGIECLSRSIPFDIELAS